jgi:hypothetical protein
VFSRFSAFKKLIAAPVIEGLTEQLADKGKVTLLKAINRLRAEKRLADESKHRPDTLDCHPLIREHFGETFALGQPTSGKAAHARLYKYL